MTGTESFAMTRHGVRDLNHPVRSSRTRVNIGPNEQAASTVSGALLAGVGVSQGRWTGFALAVIGTALAYRGTTGHCSVYSALGLNSAK